MSDWNEKYRPKFMKDIVGNKKAISDLKIWAESWNNNNPINKAVILVGKPGIGKTSAALALANEFSWSFIELNTSDVRNADKIKNIVTMGAVNETFNDNGLFLSSKFGGRKLIILDEADNLYERNKNINGNDLSDKGGKKEIINTIKITNQPIILIVNDYYNLIRGSGEILKKICKTIKFFPPYANSIFSRLKNICLSEKIEINNEILLEISKNSNGDIRSAINDLQAISINRNFLDLNSLKAISYRNREKIIFDVLRDIFKNNNFKIIKKNISKLDEDPNSILLWLNENISKEYKKINDIANAYDSLSIADKYISRVYRRQYYGFWSYAIDIMSCGVSNAKTYNYHNENYNFPSWLKKSKNYQSNQNYKNTIIDKISKKCHLSKYKSKFFIYEHFHFLFNKDLNFALNMKYLLNLDELEVIYLFGKKNKDKINFILNSQKKVKKDSFEIKDNLKINKNKPIKQISVQHNLNDF